MVAVLDLCLGMDDLCLPMTYFANISIAWLLHCGLLRLSDR
jgi:hypothetical protein